MVVYTKWRTGGSHVQPVAVQVEEEGRAQKKVKNSKVKVPYIFPLPLWRIQEGEPFHWRWLTHKIPRTEGLLEPSGNCGSVTVNGDNHLVELIPLHRNNEGISVNKWIKTRIMSANEKYMCKQLLVTSCNRGLQPCMWNMHGKTQVTAVMAICGKTAVPKILKLCLKLKQH